MIFQINFNQWFLYTKVESLTSDYEKLQKVNSHLEKNIEALEGEKRALISEVDHLKHEAANRESVLRYYFKRFFAYIRNRFYYSLFF